MENENTESGETFIIPVFKEKLRLIADDEKSTFADFARLIVFQPQVVAHLLCVANAECGVGKENRKPMHVEGIINRIGTVRTEREVLGLKDAPAHMHKDLYNLANDSYEEAVVFAHIAEIRLGRRDKAQEFFMIGLLSKVMAKDPSILEGCNEGMQRSWRQFPSTKESKDRLKGYGDPLLEEARKMVAIFRGLRGSPGSSTRTTYEEWRKAKKDIDNAFDPDPIV